MNIKELEQEIIKHKKLYYSGNPVISDYEYDILEDRLKKANPESYVLSMVGAPWENEDAKSEG